MKILVFDTETTGLPKYRNASTKNFELWPHIVQLSYILYDIETHFVIDYNDQIIKLESDIVISKESENIHKISNEISLSKGVEIYKELIEFNNILNKSDIIIAHNLEFDKNMIEVECLRNNINSPFKNNKKLEYCTMKNSVDLCKIISISKSKKEFFKYPKLFELHNHLFGFIPENLHNSMIDVLTCIRCYGKMALKCDIFEKSKTLKSLNSHYC